MGKKSPEQAKVAEEPKIPEFKTEYEIGYQIGPERRETAIDFLRKSARKYVEVLYLDAATTQQIWTELQSAAIELRPGFTLEAANQLIQELAQKNAGLCLQRVTRLNGGGATKTKFVAKIKGPDLQQDESAKHSIHREIKSADSASSLIQPHFEKLWANSELQQAGAASRIERLRFLQSREQPRPGHANMEIIDAVFGLVPGESEMALLFGEAEFETEQAAESYKPSSHFGAVDHESSFARLARAATRLRLGQALDPAESDWLAKVKTSAARVSRTELMLLR